MYKAALILSINEMLYCHTWYYITLMQVLQDVEVMLFPFEDAEGDDVDDDEPNGDQAELRADVD